MSDAKPQPKAGWTLNSLKNDGATEISWEGGDLPNDEYDEFVIRVYLPVDLAPGRTLYFPVVQECTDGAVESWIEIPEDGKSAADYERPAPGLKLLPKK